MRVPQGRANDRSTLIRRFNRSASRSPGHLAGASAGSGDPKRRLAGSSVAMTYGQAVADGIGDTELIALGLAVASAASMGLALAIGVAMGLGLAVAHSNTWGVGTATMVVSVPA